MAAGFFLANLADMGHLLPRISMMAAILVTKTTEQDAFRLLDFGPKKQQ